MPCGRKSNPGKKKYGYMRKTGNKLLYSSVMATNIKEARKMLEKMLGRKIRGVYLHP